MIQGVSERVSEHACTTCGQAHPKCRCPFTARCTCGFGRDMEEATVEAALAKARSLHYSLGSAEEPSATAAVHSGLGEQHAITIEPRSAP